MQYVIFPWNVKWTFTFTYVVMGLFKRWFMCSLIFRRRSSRLLRPESFIYGVVSYWNRNLYRRQRETGISILWVSYYLNSCTNLKIKMLWLHILKLSYFFVVFSIFWQKFNFKLTGAGTIGSYLNKIWIREAAKKLSSYITLKILRGA